MGCGVQGNRADSFSTVGMVSVFRMYRALLYVFVNIL